MTEVEFEAYVVELAHAFGWRVAGFRPAQTNKGWRTPVKYDGKGYPDLTMSHPGDRRHTFPRVVFAELKVGTNKRSPEQLAWAETLSAAESGRASVVAYRLWHPDDADEIVSLISFGRVTEWNIKQRRHTP